MDSILRVLFVRSLQLLYISGRFDPDSDEDMEEERRLAYVGITRAKEDLTLTCVKQRMLRGETQYNPVSRFVKEIPEELLDQKVPSIKKWDFKEYEEESNTTVT